MPFVEDPAHLSKARLKSDLVAHNVALPSSASKKEVYVELHLRNIEQKNTADFSSDDEEQTQEEAGSPSETVSFENGRNEDPEVTQVPDPSELTDECLKAALLKHGVKAGPIVASTRAQYEKKLRKLLLQHSNGDGELNGAEKAELYSDSEEEQEEEDKEEPDEKSDELQQKPEETKKIQSKNNKAELKFHRADFSYQQCFLLSSRLRAVPCRSGKPSSKSHSKNVLKSSERSQSSSRILAGISKASTSGPHSGLRSAVPPASKSMVSDDCSSVSSKTFSITKMVQEMESRSAVSDRTVKELYTSSVGGHCSRSNRFDMNDLDNSGSVDKSLYYTPKDVDPPCGLQIPQETVTTILNEVFPDIKTTTTRIYATPRRPIKGAAQRPIRYSLPDSLASPVTLERREVERRLVSVHIQILFFLFVACIIFFIYVSVQDSTVWALLDSFSHCFDKEGGTLLLPEAEDTPAVYEQD